MIIDKIIESLKNDNSTNRVVRTEFVEFMERLSKCPLEGPCSLDRGIEFKAGEPLNRPYIVLICCILSLRTNDKTTYPASLSMLSLARVPCEMMKVHEDTLAEAIYPVGFYRNKARQIIKLSRIICEELDSKVPDTIEGLLKFDGVGRKTANLTLAKGFGIPAICVDVHVHRVCNRLGYVKTKTPEETEFALRDKLPKKYWIDFNTLLVTHGQNVCKPSRPLCGICSISKYCEYFKAQQSS